MQRNIHGRPHASLNPISAHRRGAGGPQLVEHCLADLVHSDCVRSA
jgi:hypothetical protein